MDSGADAFHREVQPHSAPLFLDDFDAKIAGSHVYTISPGVWGCFHYILEFFRQLISAQMRFAGKFSIFRPRSLRAEGLQAFADLNVYEGSP